MFLYSIMAYLLAFASLLLSIISVSNLVPEISIDGEPKVPLVVALLKNLGLVSLFGLQHSIMARKPFKRWLTRYIPKPVERSTFVLVSGLLLALLVFQWEPMGGSIWTVAEGTFLYYVLYALFFAGWTILFISTFIINHFDLFGLRQTYLELVGKPYTQLEFKVAGFYKYVRHPLYFGGILGLWATPEMSLTHLVFAFSLTIYFIVGTLFEERDLIADFGTKYREYQKQAHMLVPFVKRK